MLAASFASPLVELLQSRIIYFHLWYDSRSGKSAVQKAAMSIWGDPERLISSYNSTSVGFERMSAAMNNLPLALDELQSASMKPEQLSHVIYMLGNGIGKMRGEKVGGLQVIRHWKNVILSTGEQLVVRTTSMDGESSRVMDIRARPIYDEDFARRVHQISEENYGWAGQKYMEYVTSLDRETLKAMYDDIMDLLETTCVLSIKGSAGKYLHSIVLISLADMLSSLSVFGCTERDARNGAFLIGAILLILLDLYEGERNSVDRAWTMVGNWVAANADHIQTENSSGMTPVYGRLYEGKLYLNPEYLKEAIEKAGFSYEKCYAGFMDKGYVDNAQRSMRISGIKTNVIGTKIDFDRSADDLLD